MDKLNKAIETLASEPGGDVGRVADRAVELIRKWLVGTDAVEAIAKGGAWHKGDLVKTPTESYYILDPDYLKPLPARP